MLPFLFNPKIKTVIKLIGSIKESLWWSRLRLQLRNN